MNKHFTLLLFIGLAWGRTTVAIFDFENNGLDPMKEDNYLPDLKVSW